MEINGKEAKLTGLEFRFPDNMENGAVIEFKSDQPIPEDAVLRFTINEARRIASSLTRVAYELCKQLDAGLPKSLENPTAKC
jgi:hypothetical protein